MVRPKMFRPKAPAALNFRADYADFGDFCKVFEQKMKPLYLLAFLLTGSHKEAELCLERSIDRSYEEKSVFQPWIEPWIKRCVIKEAIKIVFSSSRKADQQRNPWWVASGETQMAKVVNAVTQLDDLERFAFVMSVLERYSPRECSLLLDCTKQNIMHSRIRAWCKLAESDPLSIRILATPSNGRQSA